MADTFHFDAARFAATCHTLSTEKLQNNEIRFSRSKVASGFGLFYGTVATAATHGAAFPIPLYCIRACELASRKRELVRAELARRGVSPTKTTSGDVGRGFGAAWLGQLVLPFAEGLAADGAGAAGEVAAGKHVGVEAVVKETGKQIPGELVTGAVIKGHKVVRK
ncbi:hypothetical protein LTR84_009502 [Exophiala bonariae]|uniref:Uncharacterized protein n=1 Tax=Exophiala bonariae TaxID=1690606 RepID=A0AAV9MUM1_9EURO|nr:hypothetical protein LTR84_009502 [Exophiala bonariae]